jgi:tellurite resistance protein
MNQSGPSAAATAACGAYLLVAVADARVETLEEARFLGGVVNEPAFKRIEPQALAGEYNRLLKLVRDDYDAAEAEILAAIRKMRGNASGGEAVKVAARQAVIADQKLKPQEDITLSRIAGALGISAEDL